jgi:PhnB protein
MPAEVTPYLCIRDAAAAIEFYKRAFGATQSICLTEPGGRVAHAELSIDGARIMLADEYPELGVVSPDTLSGSAVTIHVYVDDVDAVFDRAVAAGARVIRPVTDQFYGDRSGKIIDPFGHGWDLATRKEEVSAREMQRRFDALIEQSKGT